ncbi:Thiolase, N-terminal domain-containing protein [Elsinoe ampelina]|uniref:acetyl-CoA C-acetyltransferase n=1 Tax=Elsinoe ampelina TaxID=302913 RepID=A0A6A6GP38_9PEZI|nr:Thiolase, N-terminal domain-containing protein [Elsinoe ampelina]
MSARLSSRLTATCRNAPRHTHPPHARLFSQTTTRSKEIQDAYIISGVRTPTGVFNGSLSSVSAPVLGSYAIKEAISRSSVPQDRITDVYMGQVLQANSGQSPARQTAIFAGLSPTTEATTINKVCASGMKAITVASHNIMLGLAEAQIAGGMENMSRVPYYLPRASQQPPFGEQKLLDGLISDGLWDVYNQIHMGMCAENTVKKYKLTREEQDEFAILSYKRAQEAWSKGLFKDEIVEVTVKGKKGDTVVKEDEGYNKLKLEKVPTLKPAFDRSGSGSVTAANSSSFNDGASALVLGNRELAKKYGKGKQILARIVATADAAVDPIDFPVAPAKVVPIVLERAGLKKSDIKIWEFNEAFAAVIKANAKILELGIENVNPRGGAISLGHAIGSSGARIVVTLLHQLKKGEYGLAAICNGGGAATGIIVQAVDADDL